MQRLKDFLMHSYYSDRTAFVFEMINVVFTVSASLTLALTADNPDMRYVYPGFFIGSLAGIYAYFRRKLAWSMLLVCYFSVVNVVGFGVAMRWW